MHPIRSYMSEAPLNLLCCLWPFSHTQQEVLGEKKPSTLLSVVCKVLLLTAAPWLLLKNSRLLSVSVTLPGVSHPLIIYQFVPLHCTLFFLSHINCPFSFQISLYFISLCLLFFFLSLISPPLSPKTIQISHLLHLQ